VQSVRRSNTLSLDSRGGVPGNYQSDIAFAEGSGLEVPVTVEGSEALQSRMFAMDDWHLRGAPSGDDVSDDSPKTFEFLQNFGQSSGSGDGSNLWGVEAGSVGQFGSFGVGDGAPVYSGLNQGASVPAQYPRPGNRPDSESEMQQPFQDLETYFAGLSDISLDEDTRNLFAAAGSDLGGPMEGVNDLAESIISGAGDSWRSIIVGSGLLGRDDF